MKVTSTRQVHVTLEEKEVHEIVNALLGVLNFVGTCTCDHDRHIDRAFLEERGDLELLRKLRTELTNAPR